MTTRVEAVSEICATIAGLVRERYRDLSLHYIVYDNGERALAFQQATVELATNPAADIVRKILAREPEPGAPLAGIAITRVNQFLGLATRDRLLALPILDCNGFAGPKEARSHAHHLAWHALNAKRHHEDPRYYSGLDDKVDLPRLGKGEQALVNLEADLFAAIVGGLFGETAGIQRVAAMRAAAALKAQPGFYPELYPFPLASDVAGLGLDRAKKTNAGRRQFFDIGLQLAQPIAATFDEQSVAPWITFAEAAQDMAWRGMTPPEIIGSAVATSDDVEIRGIGHLVTELTGIGPVTGRDIQGLYSAFASESANAAAHDKAVAQIFHETLSTALRQRSAQPFIEAANRQNAKLRRGQTLGWCAAALQAAGRAFAMAVDARRDGDAAASQEFAQEQARSTWPFLRDLGDRVARDHRAGEIFFLDDLARPGRDDPAIASLRKSLETSQRQGGAQGDDAKRGLPGLREPA